jgi:hypothetical protein
MIMRVTRRLTFGDKMLIGGLILVALISYPFVQGIQKTGKSVQIETNGNLYKVVLLSTDQTLAVSGPLGNTLVTIHHGEVHVADSPCRAKICVNTGNISHAGQLIVCVPNKVVVRVIGEEASPYDAVTQ